MHGTMRMFLLLVALTGGVAPTLAHAQKANAQQASTPTAATAGKVLARVNGKPITTADVEFASRGTGNHHGQAIPADRKAVLDNIILQELISQRAAQLGIDADPAYQNELRRLEVEVNAFKRKKLAELLLQKNTQNIQVSDAEARAYFTANAAQFRTVYSLTQILRRDEDLIQKDLRELKRGTPFDKVAAGQYSNLPTGMKPWVLGDMRFTQLPTEWKSVVNGLKKGQYSGIIRGPNNRFWIIRLNDVREDKTVNFDSAKPMILDMLKAEQAQRQSEKLIQELRSKAKIIYTP